MSPLGDRTKKLDIMVETVLISVAFLCCYVVVLLYYCIFAFLRFCIVIVLLCCFVVVLLCVCDIALLCCCIVVVLCCYAVLLSYSKMFICLSMQIRMSSQQIYTPTITAILTIYNM